MLQKLTKASTADLDENETLQDLRRRAIASKASMLRWLSANGAHPEAMRVDLAIRAIEAAESDYAAAYANKGNSASRALYFRVRVRADTTLFS